MDIWPEYFGLGALEKWIEVGTMLEVKSSLSAEGRKYR